MDERVERRSPDRQRFVLRLLRRIAVLALVLAVALWAGPRLLVEFGVLGPTAAERIEEAARAIATARAYGGSDGLAVLKTAEEEVARARALVQEGKERDARHAAQRAIASAIEAQKLALVANTQVRQQAEAVYDDLDRRINDLEKLYGEITPALSKEQTRPLLTLMKTTRQSTGQLFLAYEQEDYDAVLERAAPAREAVESARKTLEAARSR
jgi:hypothetical protein